MERKFGTLRALIILVSVLGVITCGIGVFGFAVAPYAFWSGAGLILSGIVTIALAQVFQVFVDIEHNTREANELSKKLAHNLEQYARAVLSKQASQSGLVAENPSEFNRFV